jgi:hypothetical protein
MDMTSMTEDEGGQTLDLDADDFDWGALDGLLLPCAPGDYYEMHNALGAAGAPDGVSEHDKMVFRTLSNICFLHFEPSSRNNPYTPAIQLEGRRSFDIEDLSPRTLTFLDSAVSRIGRPDLRGRVYDVLWLTRRDLGVRTALGAIEAFSELRIPSSRAPRSHMVVDCWDRAISLARLIRGAGVAAIEPLEAAISMTFDQSLADNDSFVRELSSLSIRYGLDADKRVERSRALQALASKFHEEGGYLAERVFLQAASDWEAATGRSGDYWAIFEQIAESHRVEADQEEQSADPSYMRIAIALEQAIQHYRRIPRRYRRPDFDERLRELRGRHATAGARSVEEMSLLESDPIDLSELAEGAKARVSGKSVLDALFGLITLFPIPSREDLLDAERSMSEGSISSIFGRAVLQEDGRVIARVPAANATNDEEVLLARTIENYVRRIELMVKGAIVPGLEAFNQEHCVRERELLPLVSESAAVPLGREAFFAKGLAAGFDWDFITSSHLLVPQLEAFLRYHIKVTGGDTTVLSPEGIHTEASLGTLLEMEQTKDFLGPSLTFLFDTLLVSTHGVNFRNVQAHGLIDVPTAGGVHSVFVWWLCLYLVIFPFWASAKTKRPGLNKSAQVQSEHLVSASLT